MADDGLTDVRVRKTPQNNQSPVKEKASVFRPVLGNKNYTELVGRNRRTQSNYNT